MINGDLLNEGWEVKINQGELTVNSVISFLQEHLNLSQFSSVFFYSPTLVLPSGLININGPGVGID